MHKYHVYILFLSIFRNNISFLSITPHIIKLNFRKLKTLLRMKLAPQNPFLHNFFNFTGILITCFDIYVSFLPSENDSWVFLTRKNHGYLYYTAQSCDPYICVCFYLQHMSWGQSWTRGHRVKSWWFSSKWLQLVYILHIVIRWLMHKYLHKTSNIPHRVRIQPGVNYGHRSQVILFTKLFQCIYFIRHNHLCICFRPSTNVIGSEVMSLRSIMVSVPTRFVLGEHKSSWLLCWCYRVEAILTIMYGSELLYL